ncbi:HAD hydrolase/ IA/ variant 1 family protein [Synechococcus sp. BIOS-U3-1]|uniref:HAD family hydrolase n=1 Tax=Synechococcus sp. BIOS-U3-1 TaxID=1400865 RepID=UPI0016453566|nr:HAD family hydrolase [Synechococcus sp. BIOS-U3-1]QNI57192.1 HAD hydrolase/ IA/ variant 1 family protein [Synechococcus sp. BIOS-U3-1]
MNLDDWVVVFDLDDTLISELEYQRSGISAVEKVIFSIYGIPFDGRIQSASERGVEDVWGWACEQLNLPFEVKTSFLWLYRLHRPAIQLASGIRDTLDVLSDLNANLAILSDGRSVTQRLKLAAVGLGSIPLFVSEDYQCEKPSPERFVAIEKRWPDCRYVYVADNPVKDFLAPNERGWLTLGSNWVKTRVHQIDPSFLGVDYQPSYWLSEPIEVIRQIQAAQKHVLAT